MNLLAVPNWSFGRDRDLLRRVRSVLDRLELNVHFAESDVDHNRTVTAFSGPAANTFEGVAEVAELVMPSMDLNRHVGVHPRIGALDVCPFVRPPDSAYSYEQVLSWTEEFADRFATRWTVPVYLYEKSEKGRHEADLPALRKGGFGSLAEKTLTPDFGPNRGHTHWGLSVMGVRDPLIAMNVNLVDPDPVGAVRIAREIRDLRSDGEALFLGVRALGFPLASRKLSQVSLNLTLPDLTSVDPIIEWIERRAAQLGTNFHSSELIGVIRARDLPNARRLRARGEQVVW